MKENLIIIMTEAGSWVFGNLMRYIEEFPEIRRGNKCFFNAVEFYDYIIRPGRHKGRPGGRIPYGFCTLVAMGRKAMPRLGSALDKALYVSWALGEAGKADFRGHYDDGTPFSGSNIFGTSTGIDELNMGNVELYFLHSGFNFTPEACKTAEGTDEK